MPYLLCTRIIRSTHGSRRVGMIIQVGRPMPIFISTQPLMALAMYQQLRGRK